jgi:transcription initiation factor IIE alpha subunit
MDFNFNESKLTKKEGFLFTQSDREHTFGSDIDKTYYKLFKTIARITSLNWTEKGLLTGIMSYTANAGEFYMTNEKMCEEFGISESTVTRTLKGLLEKQYIKIYTKRNKITHRVISRIIKANVNHILKQHQSSIDDYELIELNNYESNVVVDSDFYLEDN